LTNRLLPYFRKVFANMEEEAVFGDYCTPEDNHPIASNPAILTKLTRLINELPAENYYTLSVFLPHLDRVAKLHKINKMGFKNLQVVWTPTLNFGSSLLITLIVNSSTLFPSRKHPDSGNGDSSP
jgi:Rho-type GTPase-activating protein 1/2